MKKITLGATRFVVTVVAFAATAVFAETDGSNGNADGENHYILECGGQCQPALLSAIGPSFTGAWFDPAQSGHGLFIEVLPDNKIQAAWFTFNPEGTEQSWFLGVGTYVGNKATINALQPTGGQWIPKFDPHHVVNNAWGTLTLTFTDADHGKVDFNSSAGYGSGSMNLARLTKVAAGTASASIIEASFVFTGNLNVARFGHTATLLPDGKVLVAGGLYSYSGEAVSAELYEPATGTWTRTGNEVCAAWWDRTATLLANGKVLVAGRLCAELYDPTTNTWVRTGDLVGSRSGHTASRLADGRVLVAGGLAPNWYADPTASAETYDPVTGVWTLTGALAFARIGHTATVLRDGTVLVAGGCVASADAWSLESCPAASSTEIFDPHKGTWTSAGGLTVVRSGHTATLLPSGTVLFAGGGNGSEIFDPATGTSSATRDLNFPRDGAAATLLSNGDVLLTGGAGLITADAETYDTTSGKWLTAGRQMQPRYRHTATLLQDGRVLVAGGVGPPNISPLLASAELYLPAAASVGPGFTGSWYDPAQAGHGIFVEVLPDSHFLATWFAFNPAGTQQSWFLGVGTYSGDTATITSVLQPTGGRWIPYFDASKVANNPWGTFKFTFTDCNHGKVDFASSSGYGTGSMSLTRLTQPAGFACSS